MHRCTATRTTRMTHTCARMYQCTPTRTSHAGNILVHARTTYTAQLNARHTHNSYLCTHAPVHPYTNALRVTRTCARMHQCTPTRTLHAQYILVHAGRSAPLHARHTHDTFSCTHAPVHPYTHATRMTHTRAHMHQCTPTRTPHA